MNFLKSFFKQEFTIETYEGSGCIFTDGKQILSGYQPKGPYISGLGGKRECGENYHQTAMRETAEELFDITPSDELIKELQTIPYSKQFMNGSYSILVYSFDDLLLFMKIIKKHIDNSSLYTHFPETLIELILNRKIIDTAEVHQLYLLPINSELHIDKNFIKDLSLLLIINRQKN